MIYECVSWRSNGTCRTRDWVDHGHDEPNYGPYASWAGCVEARPYPYNDNDATPVKSTPATLFVPMFAPDEPGSGSAPNNYWPDLLTGTNYLDRQKYWQKYFIAPPQEIDAAVGDDGPNASCTTKPITPLTDVSVTAGVTAVKASIDEMSPTGNTNVPEGTAWGWRVLSSGSRSPKDGRTPKRATTRSSSC